jgi:hypothetical protein
MAIATAMPAPHTPTQTALTRKMIAISMRALSSSPGLPGVAIGGMALRSYS